MPDQIETYVETAMDQVRWKKARPGLAAEIRTHLLDQRDACLAQGMDEGAAQGEAVRQMGDPVALGTDLDRVHRPRPQWGLLVFALARGLGRDFAGRFVSRRLSEKYQQILQTKAPVFLTLAFLFPFFPDDLLCILAGLSSLSFRRFAVIVLLARPWGLLFASALGGAAFHVSPWAMVLIGVAGLVLFLLGMKYGDQIEAAILKRLSRRKGNDAAC